MADAATTFTPAPGAAATTAAPPPVVTTPSSTGKWYDGLDSETKGYVETKGYKDVSEVVKAQKSLETLLGGPRERLLKLPEKADAPEWGEVYKRLGKPEKADEYSVPVAEGQSDAFSKWAKEAFHGANLTKSQGDAIAAKYGEFQKAHEATEQKGFLDQAHQQSAKLKEEWGQAYDQNVALVNKVLGPEGLNLSKDEYVRGEGAFGIDGWAKFVHGLVSKLGVKVGEAPFHAGDAGGNSGLLSPDGAKERLKFLGRDKEFAKRLSQGDATTIEEFTKLNKAAYPGFSS